ncbi:MAG: polysaccharide deacetylase family protein [Clostridiaceae bacterium]|nr:polysaccharide deacetylase family protein [Clostridiaceae bacterium]
MTFKFYLITIILVPMILLTGCAYVSPQTGIYYSYSEMSSSSKDPSRIFAAPQHIPPQRPDPSYKEPEPDTRPIIALTFDDGPNPKYTDMILDSLAENSVHATFFVMGKKIESGLPQIKRILEEGHQLGNHTWDHLDLTLLKADQVKQQIMSVYDCIENLYSQGPVLVRPPFGFFNKTTKSCSDFPLITWSVDTLDWEVKNKDKVVRLILDNAKDGDIILMHDDYLPSAQAVEEVVPILIERGFRLATVSEMFEAKGITLEAGKSYFRAK